MTRARTTAALAVAALTVPVALTAAPVQATPGDTAWRADLSVVDGDDVNVVHHGGALTLRDPDVRVEGGSHGYLLLAERVLGGPVNRVSASTDGAAEVDVRGKVSDLDWTEWTPAGGVLPQAVTTVQVRVTLTGKGARVSRVDLVADSVARTRAATGPLTYRVFATREGLVGGTTANGHVIKSRDHFVALPSRRGLAPRDTGDYTVRVCRTDDSRCEYAPVWDVGPWNTKDDYWNPSSEREMWQDLPQGTPEAQAAYLDGYNDGRDEFDRTVANPAGIDLADGTFWDGLGMSDNDWVTVSYLWTGSGPTGVVSTAGEPLNVRESASTSAPLKGLAANKAKVIVECHVVGETVTGPLGTSDIWDRIGPDHYVSDTYLMTDSEEPVAPLC
ncbi:hypothetical protein [Actinokineospora sp. UTMC 2448]|uniref:hypothetical protein n=1 Tax=Actinokineospora sp. UTMC 2448 TaxID=2268449 RepID=UPI0021649618|nr:hypothetical protein [Actinokineospora sp. UTMC 2448]UVS78774.1 hypothetical protein Actkin_02510 [Actinokineospora sp. UTMC 2448]